MTIRVWLFSALAGIVLGLCAGYLITSSVDRKFGLNCNWNMSHCAERR